MQTGAWSRGAGKPVYSSACVDFLMHFVDSYQNLCTYHLLQTLSQYCVLVNRINCVISSYWYLIGVHYVGDICMLFLLPVCFNNSMSLAIPDVQTAVLTHYFSRFEGYSCVYVSQFTHA